MDVDCEESWAPKNWCFWTVVLEKTLESPLDFKEIKPVNPKGNQPWIFIGRNDAEAEAPVLWPGNMKNWLIRKDHDAGKDRRQEEKGMTEDEMVGWHHWLNGRESSELGRWWWTGRPGVLQFMGSQIVRHDWAIEMNWLKCMPIKSEMLANQLILWHSLLLWTSLCPSISLFQGVNSSDHVANVLELQLQHQSF